MKKRFVTAYCHLFRTTARKARKAWKTLDEGTKLEVIACML